MAELLPEPLPKASIPGWTRIRGTVFPAEASYAIGPRFQLQIDVRIRHLIACCPVADHEEDGILLREIQEMMAIARSSWKADAGARPNGFTTRVGHKHELALNHVNELVLHLASKTHCSTVPATLLMI